MIKARHTLTGKLVSELFSGMKMNRAFSSVTYFGQGNIPAGPVLMLANHFCWWDGFIQYRLNKKYFKKKLFVMMLEEQLNKHKILNKCGCFSVRKKSREIIKSLNYSLDILEDPGNMLLIFPQGQIESMHKDNLSFQSGIEYISSRLKSSCNVVFNVNLVDYSSGKRPGLSIFFKILPVGNDTIPAGKLEQEYNKFYRECKKKQTEII